MAKYLVRRCLWMIVVLFFVSLITFVLVYAVPADKAKSIAGTKASPEVLARITKEYGFDKPVYEQYGIYLWHLLHGNLGFSYQTQLPVATSIWQRFPATVMIAVFGIFFELLIGIPIGMISALRQYSFRDRAFTVFSLLGIAAPSFWLGMILMYALAFKIPLFHLGGYGGWGHPWYGVLPGLTLGLGGRRLVLADVAFEHARHPQHRLRQGGARQGLARAHGGAAPHPAQRLVADHHPARH